MLKLRQFISGYKREAVISPLFKMLEACFDLCVPLVMASIIDVGIANEDKTFIITRCVFLVLLGLLGLGCSITAQYFAAKAASGFGAAVRKAIFSKIMSFSSGDTDAVGTSTLISRATGDVDQLQNGLNLFLRLFTRSPFIVFGSIILAFTIDTYAALIFVGAVVLLSLAVFLIMKTTIPMYKKVREKTDTVLKHTSETLTGTRVIRAFNRQHCETAEFISDNEKLAAQQLKSGRISALTDPLTIIIVDLGIIALLYTGALKINSGSLLQGELIALISYMMQISVELVKLADLIMQVSKALACGARVKEVLNSETKMSYGEQSEYDRNAPAIVFDGVSMTYPGAAADSLHNASFTIRHGMTVGIIGGTGSGKTTLVSLISRAYDATEGEVKLFGYPISHYTKDTLHQIVAVVPQKSRLFKGTIRSNLKWGRAQASDTELLAAVETAQGGDFVLNEREGLSRMVVQGGKNLSGGQRQRMTIARALVSNSPILILDDSASALDLATDAALRKAIAKRTELTVIIVSQRTASIKNSDMIIVLDDGEICGIGTHDALLDSCTVYNEIYMSQFKDSTDDGKA